MRRVVLLAGVAGTIGAGVGCSSNELETGYQFQRLGSSTASQRRAYYAGPFSPEARAAMMEGDEPSGAARRPRPGM